MIRKTKQLGLEHRRGQFTSPSGPFQGQSNYEYVNKAVENMKNDKRKRAQSIVTGKKPLDSLMTSPDIKTIAKQS